MKTYQHFYNNHTYTIFAPGLDRFILTDNTDFWITMQTAELLCSKLPTVMFIIPQTDMDNPTDYTLINKKNLKIGPSTITSARQYPQMKYHRNKNDVIYVGQPIDSNIEDILKLTEFAKYVHDLSYSISITEQLYNPYNNSTFLEKYIGVENIDNLIHKHDRSNKNVFKLLRRTVYDSMNIDEIKTNITQIWLDNYHEQEYLIQGFYHILQEPVPDQLKDHVQYVPETVSTYIV